MLSYCLKYRKNTVSKNPKIVKTKNGKTMLLSIFIKEEEASGLLGSLGIKAPLSKILLASPFCFKCISKLKEGIK